MTNNQENIKELIESKFYCSARFSEAIEKIVLESRNMTYIDAIVYFCEENGIEVESVTKLLSKPLKERLRVEATELNMLKRTTRAKLPL